MSKNRSPSHTSCRLSTSMPRSVLRVPRTNLLLHRSEPMVDLYEKMFCLLRLAYEKAFTEHDWTTLRLHLEGELLVAGRSSNMRLGLGDFVLQARRAAHPAPQLPPSPTNSEHHAEARAEARAEGDEGSEDSDSLDSVNPPGWMFS